MWLEADIFPAGLPPLCVLPVDCASNGSAYAESKSLPTSASLQVLPMSLPFWIM